MGSDRLGHFNLSMDGHGEAVRHMKNYGVPIMYLGGGGYTLKNVSRVWTYETSIIGIVSQFCKELLAVLFSNRITPVIYRLSRTVKPST